MTLTMLPVTLCQTCGRLPAEHVAPPRPPFDRRLPLCDDCLRRPDNRRAREEYRQEVQALIAHPLVAERMLRKYYDRGVDGGIEAFLTAERLKQAMRTRYRLAAAQRAGKETWEEGHRWSYAFWAEYEDINRRYIPSDPVYSKVTTGTALSTTLSTWDMKSAASGQLRILEVFIGGEATSSAVIRVFIGFSTAGSGTAPTTYTPEKFNTRSPAAAGVTYGAVSANADWGTTENTLNSNPAIVSAFNAFGGTDRWVSAPGAEIYNVNAEYNSMRSLSGTSTISQHTIFEEL